MPSLLLCAARAARRPPARAARRPPPARAARLAASWLPAFWLAAAGALSGCGPAAPAQAPPREVPPPVVPAAPPPAPRAEAESESASPGAARERLVRLLSELSATRSFALGHQDTTAYGVGWSNEGDRSDVKSVCGSHVAVHGWDVFGIEKGAAQNGDGVDFERMRALVAAAHRRGAINTISWHLDNPVSGKSAWDRTPAVRQILPGQPRHAAYEAQLERLAAFLGSLRADSGEPIPIIFRPFHEHTASWFWWGGANTNRRDYVALWRYTVDYLRQRGLGQLLFAYSPAAGDVYSEESYLHRYPGDEYVDVFGVDHYYKRAGSKLVRVLEVVVRAAEARGKVPALTEFGAQDGLNSGGVGARWLLTDFLRPLRASPLAARIAYALAWRNASEAHCFLPYPGHSGAPALEALCADERVLLQNDLASLPSAGAKPRL